MAINTDILLATLLATLFEKWCILDIWYGEWWKPGCYKCCASCRLLRKMETLCSLWTSKIWTVWHQKWFLKGKKTYYFLSMEVSFILVLKCTQVNPRIERSVRSRIKIVKNGGCFALFSETKLQVCSFCIILQLLMFAHSLWTSFISKGRCRADR